MIMTHPSLAFNKHVMVSSRKIIKNISLQLSIKNTIYVQQLWTHTTQLDVWKTNKNETNNTSA